MTWNCKPRHRRPLKDPPYPPRFYLRAFRFSSIWIYVNLVYDGDADRYSRRRKSPYLISQELWGGGGGAEEGEEKERGGRGRD